MTTSTTSSTTTRTAASTQKDRDCAVFARSALFPSRYHRDVADDHHFPALLALDRLRQETFRDIPASTLFPRHVVVVRDLATGGIQWNGQPDIVVSSSSSSSNDKNDPSVTIEVIPNHVSVRCTSTCDQILKDAYQKAFLVQKDLPLTSPDALDNPKHKRKLTEIVLCSDRILHRDDHSKQLIIDPNDAGSIAKELPPKSLRAVEEVLAHQLIKTQYTLQQQQQQQQQQQSESAQTTAQMEVAAAKAAECYYSRHDYQGRPQVKKGSQLPVAYSWMPSLLKERAMQACLQRVSWRNVVAQEQTENISRDDLKQAVQQAMQHQSSSCEDC